MNVTSLAGLTGSSSLSTLQSLLTSQTTQAATQQSDTSSTSAGSPRPPPPPPPPSGSGGTTPQSLFEALVANDDTDGDGLLSQSEIDASPVSDLLSDKFGAIDTDGDGLLSQTELDTAESGVRSRLAAGGAGQAAAADPGSLYQSVFDALMSESDANTATSSDRERAGQFLDLLSKIG